MRHAPALVGALALAAAPAAAGPLAEVPSAADPGDPIDVHGGVDYELQLESASIVREQVGLPGVDPTDPIPEVRDLVASHRRHTVTPHVEVGVWRDVWLALALPVVISDRRTLRFDQRDTPCSFGADASCVNATNSTSVLDGILPAAGFDADDPGAGLPADDALIFRGVARAGLDQLHLGVGWAPMNQRRDDTKPTWRLGAELRLAVGAPARFDAVNPDRETGVGQGAHQVRLWTAATRRLGRLEPFVVLDYLTTLSVASDSPFVDPGFGARNTDPQARASVRAGVEVTAVERADDGTGVALELEGRARARFEGRGYSPMWEAFAHAGDARGTGPLILDADPTAAGVQALSHPGVTHLENSLELGGRLAVRARLGRHVELAAQLDLARFTAHAITYADAGVDAPSCADGQAAGCEATNNELVTPGTSEVSPLHVPIVDLVGHRYRAEDAWAFAFGATGTVRF